MNFAVRPNYADTAKVGGFEERQMDNVLQDMVQRLRAIELLLRTQNELLTRVLAELEQNRRYAEASKVVGVLPAPAEPSHRTNMLGKLRAR